MLSQDSAVTVFAFRSYDPVSECPRFSGFKATLEAIRAMGADPLPATAEAVPDELVDEHGCFRRRATGWGSLD